MNTNRWIVDKNVDSSNSYPQITQAAELLRNNEVVAFPTETVYGLGGNAESGEAVEKIFAAKGRPSDNPLIIHIANIEQLHRFVSDITESAQLLMKAFWPGPLTIILPKRDEGLSEKASAGLSTIAVRMPAHPIALALIKETGLPIAAPSANRSGKPSPTTAQHVWDDLNGRIAAIMDGGPTGVGVESTVIDCTGEVPTILRPGGVTIEQLQAVIGKVAVDRSLVDSGAAPKSPGMKYRHYAPDAPLFLVDGTREFIQQLINEKRAEGLTVGVLTTEENETFYDCDDLFACGQRQNLSTVAAALYDALRYFNNRNVDMIYSEVFPEEGVGAAIMNRLLKAAGHRIIKK